jgi:hypothetical protein
LERRCVFGGLEWRAGDAGWLGDSWLDLRITRRRNRIDFCILGNVLLIHAKYILLRQRALRILHELVQHRDVPFPAGLDVRVDARIRAREPSVDLGGAGVEPGADERGDLVHLAREAVRLREHVGQRARCALEQLRLRVPELGEQRRGGRGGRGVCGCAAVRRGMMEGRGEDVQRIIVVMRPVMPLAMPCRRAQDPAG